MSLDGNFDDVKNDFKTEVEINIGDKFYQLLSKKKNKPLEPKEILRSKEIDDYSFVLKIFDNNNNLLKTITDTHQINDEFNDFYTTFLRHGIPNNHLYLFEEPFNFSFVQRNSIEIEKSIRDTNTLFFIRYLIMFYHTFYLRRYNFVKEETIKTDIRNFFNINYSANLRHVLKQFTEVQDVKLNENIFINKIDNDNSYISHPC